MLCHTTPISPRWPHTRLGFHISDTIGVSEIIKLRFTLWSYAGLWELFSPSKEIIDSIRIKLSTIEVLDCGELNSFEADVLKTKFNCAALAIDLISLLAATLFEP